MGQTTENLTQYLKMASELESSIYRQERVLEAAEQALDISATKLRIRREQKVSIAEPKDGSHELKAPKKPVRKTTDDVGRNFTSLRTSGTVYIVSAVIIAGVGIWIGSKSNALFVPIICLIAAAGFGILGIRFLNAYKSTVQAAESNYAAACEKYERDLASYKKKIRKAKAEYESELAQYSDRVEILKIEKQQQDEQAAERHERACQEVELLKAPLEETRELLAKLYSNGWVFEKYRNMVAMATMYEYFASGRCSELTGPVGAYNLYEQELRQNLIINKLDVISSQLEDIKDNQYVLYTEMKKTNECLSEIRSTIRDISDGVDVVAANTGAVAKAAKVAAYYSEITAQNTEALKYIELVS